VHVGPLWLGKRSRDLAEATGARIAFVTRYGAAFLPDDRTVVQDGDLVHLLFPPDRRDEIELICEKGPVRS